MKIEFRLITAALITAVLLHQSFRRLRAPIRWMKTLPWICSLAPSSTTMFMRNESHSVVSLTTRKKPPMLIFSSPFAKSTTPNAAEIPKSVRSLPVTAFIVVQAKSRSGKQLRTHGTPIKARKPSSVRTQVAPAEASAIMICCR
jgi:hypothetical protein